MRDFNYDANDGRGHQAPPPSDTINTVILAAGTAKRVAIPAGAKYVLFSGNVDFWVRIGGASINAAIATADVTDGSGSEFSPAGRRIVPGLTHVSLISPDAGVISLSFY